MFPDIRSYALLIFQNELILKSRTKHSANITNKKLYTIYSTPAKRIKGIDSLEKLIGAKNIRSKKKRIKGKESIKAPI